MTINILKTHVGVNYGDHGETVTTAVEPKPYERLDDLLARTLDRIDYSIKHSGTVGDEEKYLTIRVTEGHEFPKPAPTIVCVCGSTRFREEIEDVRAKLTLEDKIVIGSEVWVRSDPAYADLHDTDAKDRLDALHLAKIDLADEVFICNVGGYIGNSTKKEIAHAMRTGKPVTYLEPLIPEEER